MTLVFKLVGYTANKKYYEIRDPFNGPINLQMITELYKVWGLTNEEISNIKFITDSEQIKNHEKNYDVKENEDRLIYVFASNSIVKQKLFDIFVKEGHEVQVITKVTTDENDENDETDKTTNTKTSYTHSESPVYQLQPIVPDPEISQPITQVIKSEPIPVLTSEVIDMMNVKSVSLFADTDFKNLISIYMRKPELFSVFAKYVQNGNVVEESLSPVVTVDMLSDSVLSIYKKSCQEIKNLGINYADNIIMDRLIKYSGHLNLTVRSLLCELACETTSI